MPILLIDGFDHYATADIAKKWTTTNAGTISAGTGRGSSASLRLTGSQNGPAFSVSNLPTVYIGFAMKLQNAGATMHMLRLMDGGAIQLDLGITPSNFMVVKRNGATVVATATTGAITAGTYYYIESRFTLHASAGIAEVRVNGVTVINATGLNLITSANAYCNSVMMMSAAGTGTHDFDDFVLTTDAFFGDCRVVTLLPTGAGNYSQWSVPAYSYGNPGGSGNRTATITVTQSGVISAGALSAMVDGNTGAGASVSNGVAIDGTKYVRFDFGTGASRIIKEVTHILSGAENFGTWKWQGSNDASAWTDIGSSFVLTSATATFVNTQLAANSTGYRYYQVVGVSGTTPNFTAMWEYNFLIDAAGTTPAAWQNVDDVAMNGDVDYVSSATPGQRNSYDFPAVGSGLVKAVQHVTAVRKDDLGTRIVKQFARIGGTDYDATAVSVADTYGMTRRIMDVSPATGTAWTISELDAAEFGTKMES